MHATLLVGGTTVQLDPLRVEEQDLVIHGDKLGDLQTEIPTTSTVDCSGCLILPGFVVGHTHLYSGLAAGMPGPAVPPTNFKEILEKVWWRLDRALDQETLKASVLTALMSAVRAGATCIIDHHESPNFIDGSLDVIADGLEEIGIRGVLCYGATDRNGPEGAKAGLTESERFLERAKGSSMVRGLVGLHAPFTCSKKTMKSAAEIANRHDGWLHYHAAEGKDDQAAAKSWGKKRLLPALDELGLLNERSILAHLVDIDDDEAKLLKDRSCWVTHQARSNMNNGVGYASRVAGLDNLALGTDGIDNDMITELRSAFFRSREATGPTGWRDPLQLLSGGHRLAGALFGEAYGSLEPGAPGDLVVLSYRGATPVNADTIGGHLLFGLSSLYVRDVFIAGRTVMRNRRLIGIDERAIANHAHQAAKELWGRMKAG